MFLVPRTSFVINHRVGVFWGCIVEWSAGKARRGLHILRSHAADDREAGGARLVCDAMKVWIDREKVTYEEKNVTLRVGNYGVEAIAYLSEAEDNVATVLAMECPHAGFHACNTRKAATSSST